MIYLSLALVAPLFWFGPWWLLMPVSFMVGYQTKGRGSRVFALSSGLAWAALSFIRDGELGGVIGTRMAGMFSLPNKAFLFLLIMVLGFVTAWLWFNVGRVARLAWRG